MFERFIRWLFGLVASGAWHLTKRLPAVARTLALFKLLHVTPASPFEDVYHVALVTWGVGEHGLGQPRSVLRFVGSKTVCEAFEQAHRAENWEVLLKAAEEYAQSEEGSKLIGDFRGDLRGRLTGFKDVFEHFVQAQPTPSQRELRGVVERVGATLDGSRREDLVWQRDTTDQLDRIEETVSQTPRRQGRPPTPPDMPARFVERPTEYGRLRDLILGAGRDRHVAISGRAALAGAGGFGKTSLAIAVCHDPDIAAAFPDGILWITLGERPDVIDRLNALYEVLGTDGGHYTTREGAENAVARALGDKKCLLVLDDVWTDDALRPFFRDGPNCVRLVTTRRPELVRDFESIDVDEMTGPESVQMLTAGVGPTPESLRDAFEALASLLGGWPLLLELANAALRRRMRHGEHVATALHALAEAHQREGPAAFDRTHPRERNDAVAHSVGVSLAFQREVERRQYVELGIFPEDVPVPIATAARLWGMEDTAAETVLMDLADLSLLKLDLASGTARLHDVMRSYLRLQLDDAPLVHDRLISRWGDPFNLPDAYAWRWFAWHMKEAGRTDELRKLLFDVGWLEAKLGAIHDPNALLSDYDLIPGDADVRLVQGAIRLSAHVLVPHPDQLRNQLVGRLGRFEAPALREFVEAVRRPTHGPALRLISPTLTPPGGPLLRVLAGHTDWVRAVAVTPDGARAVSGSWDNTVRVWDLATGEALRVLAGHTLPVAAVAVTPDGARAVSGSLDRTVRVWDPATGETLRTLEGHTDWVRAVAVTPDGTRAVSGSADHTVRVWDLATGETLRTLKGHADGVTAIAVTPDGTRAVSGSYDATVRVWDLATGEALRTLVGHTDWVRAVAVTPDGTRVVSGSDYGTVRVWDLATGKALRTLDGHAGEVTVVAVTPDGTRAVAGSDDKTVRVWDLATGEQVALFVGDSRLSSCAVAPDGVTVVAGDQSGRVHFLRLDV